MELGYSLGYVSEVRLCDDFVVRCHPVSSHAFAGVARHPELAEELQAFISYCTPGMQLLDVGGSYGLMTLAALRYGGTGTRVVVVEPGATARRILTANLMLAGEESRARIVAAAAGAYDGTVPMLTTGPAGEHHLLASTDCRPDAMQVPQRTLGTIAAEHRIVPTHIKIDVEGFEFEVLQGGQELIARAKPIVFLELHARMLLDRGCSPRDVLALLSGLGYTRILHDQGECSIDEACESAVTRVICMPPR